MPRGISKQRMTIGQAKQKLAKSVGPMNDPEACQRLINELASIQGVHAVQIEANDQVASIDRMVRQLLRVWGCDPDEATPDAPVELPHH